MEDEIYRLKVKCNTYAKRLVNEGFDDVEWEVTDSISDAPGNAQQTLQPDNAEKNEPFVYQRYSDIE